MWNAKGKEVVIEGHTDSIGNSRYNRQLSIKRAVAVKKALVQIGAKNAGSFLTEGYGEARPIATNSTLEGRQKNRRVEFHYK
jgi:OOP family OmpA-OmpF porin